MGQITSNDVLDFFNGTINLIKEQEVGKELLKRSMTANGNVSMNPNLNGFIAENWHELTFNFNAQRAGSPYTAKALIPEHGYAKNSMDLGVYKNGTGWANGRYQLKYGKTAEETIKYIKQGNYTGQQLIVPKEQVEAVQKAFPNRKVSAVAEIDGITSDPLSKAKAVEMQSQMQNGTFKQQQTMQLVKGTFGQMAKGAAIGGAITATVETVSLYKQYKNGNISGKDYLKEIGKAAGDGAVTGGATAGLMIPVTMGIKAVAGVAVASCPLVTIPVSFVIGAAVSKLVAPAFGRGDYKKILGEAKFYQNLMDMNTDLVHALDNSARQLESFFEEYSYQLQEHERLTAENQALKEMHMKANAYIEQKNEENKQLISDLGNLYTKI